MPIHTTATGRIVENEKTEVEYISNSNSWEIEFHYQNSTIDQIKSHRAKGIQVVTIRNCEVKELHIDRSNIATITIENSFIDTIFLIGELGNGKVHINKPLDLAGKMAVNRIKIRDSNILGFTLQSVYVSALEIEQNTSIKKLHIENSAFDVFQALYNLGNGSNQIQELTMHGSNVRRKFEISDCIIGQATVSKSGSPEVLLSRIKFDLSDLKFTKSEKVSIHSCTANQFTLGYGDYTNVAILGGEYENVFFSPKSLKSLFIGSSYHKGSKERLRVSNLNFGYMPKFGESIIRINDLEVGTLDLSEFDNNGKFEMTNADIDKCVMDLTRLGEAVFNIVSLKELHLNESIIDQARFANIVWPKGNALSTLPQTGTQKRTKDERKKELVKIGDAYRQLKIVCLNAHDKVNAMAFQRHEINQTWRIANLTWRENFGNWLILGSNKLFSDFGQSLSRPLTWLVTIHAIIFARLWNAFNLTEAVLNRCDELGCNPKWETLSIFAAMINPAHDHIVLGIDVFGFTDFVMRISAGFFIYYFLRATRKFNFSS